MTWPLTYENMWLPVEVPNDLKFLWKNRLEPKIQFRVPLQYIYELIGDQIPNFPLTLHWNYKYLKSQDTNSVSLHLKLLPLTFSRRQEQYPRKSIDSLDNGCPWLDWQVILKVTGLYLLHLHQKCTWPLNIGIFSCFFLRWLFLRSHLGHVGVMWPTQSYFLDLANFTNQDGGLANRTKLTNTAKNHESKTNQTRGVFWILLFKDMATKMVKKLINCETPDLL